jgi:hypothetical protein
VLCFFRILLHCQEIGLDPRVFGCGNNRRRSTNNTRGNFEKKPINSENLKKIREALAKAKQRQQQQQQQQRRN